MTAGDVAALRAEFSGQRPGRPAHRLRLSRPAPPGASGPRSPASRPCRSARPASRNRGWRASSSSKNTRASSRARLAPRQMCSPNPKARWGAAVRRRTSNAPGVGTEDRLVSVGRRVQHDQECPRRYRRAGELHVDHGRAAEGLDGGDPAEHLLDRRGQECTGPRPGPPAGPGGGPGPRPRPTAASGSSRCRPPAGSGGIRSPRPRRADGRRPAWWPARSARLVPVDCATTARDRRGTPSARPSGRPSAPEIPSADLDGGVRPPAQPLAVRPVHPEQFGDHGDGDGCGQRTDQVDGFVGRALHPARCGPPHGCASSSGATDRGVNRRLTTDR